MALPVQRPQGREGSPGGDRPRSLWTEPQGVSVVDKEYILHDARRRKQNIDFATEQKLQQLEADYQQQRDSILLQAEHHARMSDAQIELEKQKRLDRIHEEEEALLQPIFKNAEEEKGRIGEYASQTIMARSQRERAASVGPAAAEVDRHAQATLQVKMPAPETQAGVVSTSIRPTSALAAASSTPGVAASTAASAVGSRVVTAVAAAPVTRYAAASTPAAAHVAAASVPAANVIAASTSPPVAAPYAARVGAAAAPQTAYGLRAGPAISCGSVFIT